jgi:hypothetical protein
MDSGRGVAALVKLALHCEDRLNLETLTLGTNLLLPGAACVGEFCGRHLLYVVAVDGERIRLLVTPMDKGDEPERIVSIDDTPENWMVIFRIVRALEWSGLASLQPRPHSIGPPAGGPDSFVLA